MKPVKRQWRGIAGFTIVELLTVISIIVILIGLLVPALNMVKRYAKKVSQKNQFHAIKIGLETYNAEWDGYPPSRENGDFCGAMKLCEALVGLDRRGFKPGSKFEWTLDWAMYNADVDLSDRRPYLTPDNSNAYALGNVNGPANTGPYDPKVPVICDMYPRVTNQDTGRLIGMPVLYFKADTTKTLNDYTKPEESIINYMDNMGLFGLKVAWDPGLTHVITPAIFYEQILNKNLPSTVPVRPYNADSYILMSAGFDGLYGTDDDVFNFGM